MSKCIICGQVIPYGKRYCPSCIMSGYHIESEVSRNFVCCPICGSGRIRVNLISENKATIKCEKCGARWRPHFNPYSKFLEWAELQMEADDGRGEELLEKQIKVDTWREMALESRKKLRATRDR